MLASVNRAQPTRGPARLRLHLPPGPRANGLGQPPPLGSSLPGGSGGEPNAATQTTTTPPPTLPAGSGISLTSPPSSTVAAMPANEPSSVLERHDGESFPAESFSVEPSIADAAIPTAGKQLSPEKTSLLHHTDAVLSAPSDPARSSGETAGPSGGVTATAWRAFRCQVVRLGNVYVGGYRDTNDNAGTAPTARSSNDAGHNRRHNVGGPHRSGATISWPPVGSQR